MLSLSGVNIQTNRLGQKRFDLNRHWANHSFTAPTKGCRVKRIVLRMLQGFKNDHRRQRGELVLAFHSHGCNGCEWNLGGVERRARNERAEAFQCCISKSRRYSDRPDVNIRNVILDWSGTTVDDVSAVWKSTNHVLTAHNHRPISLEKSRNDVSSVIPTRMDASLRFLPRASIERLFIDEYHNNQGQISLLPQAVELLEFCGRRAWKVFLVATMDARTYVRLSDRFGLSHFPVQPYLGAEDKAAKVRRIIAENGLDPAATLLVGDMKEDVEAGKAAQLQTCAVLTGIDSEAHLRALQPDFLCNDLGELRSLLEKL